MPVTSLHYPPPSPQEVATARRLVANPHLFLPKPADQWQDLVATAWMVLRFDRQARRNHATRQLITTHEGGAA